MKLILRELDFQEQDPTVDLKADDSILVSVEVEY